MVFAKTVEVFVMGDVLFCGIAGADEREIRRFRAHGWGDGICKSQRGPLGQFSIMLRIEYGLP